MIVKLKPGVGRLYPSGSTLRKNILENENGWFKVVVPYERSYVNIFVNGQKARILTGYILQIINDDRYCYECCSACGYVQPIGESDHCGKCNRLRKDGYLCRMALPPGGKSQSPDGILKESVTKSFGIRL